MLFGQMHCELWFTSVMILNNPPNTRAAMQAQPLTLTNPLSHAVTVTITVSNPRLFQILHPPIPPGKLPTARVGPAPPPSYRVTLEASSQTEVQLVYWPSSLTESEKTRVEVSSEEIGNEVFLVEVCFAILFFCLGSVLSFLV